MKQFCLLLFIVHVSGVTREDGKEVFFRKDYKLLEEFGAFYKYHKVRLNFSDASYSCSAEGGSLFRPLSLAESVSVVANLMPNDVPRIWIGIHDLFSEGEFITLDGISLEDTYSNWAPGEPNDNNNQEDCVVLYREGTFNDGTCSSIEPYVCKKNVSTVTQNPPCQTYDLGYEYSPELDKCYKIHTTPVKWTDAFKKCKGEEANLAIINSEAESKYLINRVSKYPVNSNKGNFDTNNFYLGFNDLIHNGIYRTVDGKSLGEAGYEKWSSGQRGGDEHCGSMLRDGTLNALDCNSRAMFFCERDLSRQLTDRVAGQPGAQVTEGMSSVSETTEQNKHSNVVEALVELPDAR